MLLAVKCVTPCMHIMCPTYRCTEWSRDDIHCCAAHMHPLCILHQIPAVCCDSDVYSDVCAAVRGGHWTDKNSHLIAFYTSGIYAE